MKALVLEEYNRLSYREVPEPPVGEGEVRVGVRACGICGSDVHGLDGSTGRRIPPLIMGHEASGTIVELGPGVEGWKKGERVTFDSTIYCGRCWHCRRGEINLCDSRRVLGVSCQEYRQDGAFAEYITVPQRVLYRLPEGLPFEQATAVEALSVAVHAVGRLRPALGDSALVVGAGMIGLLSVQALRAAGCGRIIAVDLAADRLERALALGADLAMRSDDPELLRRVAAETGGRGADLAVEAVGVAATVQTAVAGLRKGGKLALVGNVAPVVQLPLQAVVTRELSLLGSCASRGEYPACLQLIAGGAVRVDTLISAVAPLAEGAAWFQRLRAGEKGLMKVVLAPAGGGGEGPRR
jgi:L-iditol 2-dehydrogenase